MKQNVFVKWIEESGGSGKVAARLGVCMRTVGYWKQGKVKPTARTIEKILKLSKGKVSITSILELGAK